MLKRNNEKGVTLLELVLVLALLGFIIIILIKYINEKAKELKLQTTAHQIERTIDDATSYVSSRFTQVYNTAFANNGIVDLDLDTVNDSSSSDLLSYTNNSPYSTDYEAIVRIPYNISNPNNLPEEKSLQIILYAINNKNHITWLDSKNLAKIIKGSQGGIVYTPASTLSPCVSSTTFCIENPYGIWLIEDTLPIANTDITNKINTLNPVLGIEESPAIAVISNITESQASSKYLSKDENLNNRNENTMETDLNIDDSLSDSSSIFFNAVPNTDVNAEPNSLKGSHLIYKDTVSSLSLDSDGNIIQDGNGNNLLSPIINPSLTFTSNKTNSSGEDEVPTFLSKGGIKTNFTASEGTSCDIKQYGKVIAVDATTGELLRCYENENYQYNPDSDNDGNIDTAFIGDWRKIDWKKSMYFLSVPNELYKHENVENDQACCTAAKSTAYTFLGGDGKWWYWPHKIGCSHGPYRCQETCFVPLSGSISVPPLTDLDNSEDIEEANFLIFEIISRGTGTTTLSTPSDLFSIKSEEKFNAVKSQFILPIPEDKNLANWLIVGSTLSAEWSLNIVGYIK